MATKSNHDYYQILQIARTSTDDEVKKGYHRLAKVWHPDKADKSKAKEAESKFKEISLAYNTLSDPAKRRLYDIRLDSQNYATTEESTDEDSYYYGADDEDSSSSSSESEGYFIVEIHEHTDDDEDEDEEEDDANNNSDFDDGDVIVYYHQ